MGGLTLDEPAADLAVILAVASSYLDKPVRSGLAVFGEVGLSGEVRAVSGTAQRLAEIARLGFDSCILPKACRSAVKESHGLELHFVSDIKEAIKAAKTGEVSEDAAAKVADAMNKVDDAATGGLAKYSRLADEAEAKI